MRLERIELSTWGLKDPRSLAPRRLPFTTELQARRFDSNEKRPPRKGMTVSRRLSSPRQSSARRALPIALSTSHGLTSGRSRLGSLGIQIGGGGVLYA